MLRNSSVIVIARYSCFTTFYEQSLAKMVVRELALRFLFFSCFIAFIFLFRPLYICLVVPLMFSAAFSRFATAVTAAFFGG